MSRRQRVPWWCAALAAPAPLWSQAEPASPAPKPAPAQANAPLSPLPGRSSSPRDPLLASKYDLRDAARDEPWPTEVDNEQVGAQLSELARRLAASVQARAPIEPAALAALAREDVACAPLRPAELPLVFDSAAARVQRWSRPAGQAPAPARGLAAFAGALAELVRPFQPGSELHVKFKIVDVRRSPSPAGEDAVEITAYVMADGRGESCELEQTATWRSRWLRDAPGAPPRLEALALEAFEECRGAAGRGPLFQEHTQSALGGTVAWREQLTKSLDHWAGRIDVSLGGAIVGHEGIALGDFDGDGLDDLYVCQSGGLPNRLFRHLPDGTLEDVSAACGVDFLDATRSALFVDLDGDGDQDLALGIDPWLVLLSNRGAGGNAGPRFELAAKLAAPSVTSLAAADVENDGDLDLYVCTYMLPDREETTPVPYHDANNGPPDILYRNGGGFAFDDATRELGLDEHNRRFSFAASFEDYDDDGDQDLCVANDFGRKNLFRNEGGKFRDVAAEAGVEDIGAGMGVTWGDYDGDGRLDLYLSNMFSSAGERVTHQGTFRPELDAVTRASFQRHARGNSLFRNQGDGTFRDVSLESGTTMGRWAWGAKFVDFDSDGRCDIVVPNGFVTGEDPHDL